MSRATCAYCYGSRGDDYRTLVALARRAGLRLLAGATHLHQHCASRVTAAMRVASAPSEIRR